MDIEENLRFEDLPKLILAAHKRQIEAQSDFSFAKASLERIKAEVRLMHCQTHRHYKATDFTTIDENVQAAQRLHLNAQKTLSIAAAELEMLQNTFKVCQAMVGSGLPILLPPTIKVVHPESDDRIDDIAAA
ncbi:hypothetical protein C5Y96_09945 [Blastopirellula marina]|uniref:Uncharacterized protein n=1 Tax=Blastopirellula marina TaxID=124 RepID=A0A2S8FLV5_9BACT|nr:MULTISPECIES: hypothetical protein [Pirellulaceae]PQO33172.1 hypothetical protein C5Y96_09945 [Blastopirellula marina]RCS52261.1 hypothetical protein DTL36_09955 [Bremerella cremea]